MANNNPLTSTVYRPDEVIRIELKKCDQPLFWTVEMRGGIASDSRPTSCKILVKGYTPKEALEDFFDTVEALSNDPHETMQP